jgi:hypothetical protein
VEDVLEVEAIERPLDWLPRTWPPALDALVAPRGAATVAAIYPGGVLDLLRALREDGLNIDYAASPEGFASTHGGEYVAPAIAFTSRTLAGGVEVFALALQETIGPAKLTRTRLDVAVYVHDEAKVSLVYEGAGPAIPVLAAMRGAARAWRRSVRLA